MNNYIKPAIKLATVDANGNTVSCGTTAADMELIQSIVGGADASKTFNSNEGCEIPVPIDFFCKFTSADTGGILIFWS